MSRGLGKTQKRVLRLLGISKWKSLSDLHDKLCYRYKDGNSWPRNAYMSIYRAVRTLEKRGLVETRKRIGYGKCITGRPSSWSYIVV